MPVWLAIASSCSFVVTGSMIVTAIFAVPVGLPRPRFLGTGLSFGFIVKTTLRLYLKKFQSLLKKFLYCQEVSAMCRAYNDENDEKDHASQVRSCVAQLAHVARRWPGRADRRLRRRNLRGGRAQCLGGAGLGRARPTWARAGALSCASERTSQKRAPRGGSTGITGFLRPQPAPASKFIHRLSTERLLHKMRSASAFWSALSIWANH